MTNTNPLSSGRQVPTKALGFGPSLQLRPLLCSALFCSLAACSELLMVVFCAGMLKQMPRACCGAAGVGEYNFNLTSKCGEPGDPSNHWSWDGAHPEGWLIAATSPKAGSTGLSLTHQSSTPEVSLQSPQPPSKAVTSSTYGYGTNGRYRIYIHIQIGAFVRINHCSCELFPTYTLFPF